MPSQRTILGTGLAILLLIGAASIGLDLKSRADNASVDHALEVLKRISDLRPMLRSAESAARAFAVTGDPDFVREHREASAAFLAAFDDLLGTVTTPIEALLLDETKALVARQIAISSELVRLQSAGDRAGIAELMARPAGRTVTAEIGAKLERSLPRSEGCWRPAVPVRDQRAHPAGDRSRRRGADPGSCDRAR